MYHECQMIAATALLLLASALAPKHIVLVAADQEYRSEESMPALARILEQKHGFRCTVLYPIDPKTGEINVSVMNNVPGLEALRTADLMILFARMVELPDAQMKEIIDYTESGRPIVALRTATHPFNYKLHPENPYARYSFQLKEHDGGYGRLVLGETWIRHWGAHQKQSTRGVIVPEMRKHPILKGVKDIWGPSDVYEITTLTGDSRPLVMGEVLDGMTPDSPPDSNKRAMPVAWVKSYTGSRGRAARIFTTTMGHAGDFRNEGFRRMVINASYWGMGLEKKIRPNSDVGLIGTYDPNPIGFGKQKTGLRP